MLLGALDAGVEPALVAAAVAVVYRVVAAIAYRNRPLVRVMAEEVPASELRYVVPFEARSRYVGADYVEQLAKSAAALPPQPARRRDPRLARHLTGRPSTRPGAPADPRVLRAHQPFRALDRPRMAALDEARLRDLQAPGRASRSGQAVIPSNIEEAQRGMVSTIDTIALDGDEEIDIRGWIRTFADSGGRSMPAYTRASGRGPRLCERRFPDPQRQLHRHAPASQRRRARPRADVANRPRLPGSLPELGRQRTRRADRPQAALFPGTHLRLRRRRRAEDRPQLLPGRTAIPDPPLRDRAPAERPTLFSIRRSASRASALSSLSAGGGVARIVLARRAISLPLRVASTTFARRSVGCGRRGTSPRASRSSTTTVALGGSIPKAAASSPIDIGWRASRRTVRARPKLMPSASATSRPSSSRARARR